jgi:hypothetical protein
MKAQELRIGNWVLRKSTGKPHRVVGLYKGDLGPQGSIFIDIPAEQRLMYRLHKDGVQPIPLTPEILEKCGFARHNGKWKHINSPFYLHAYIPIIPEQNSYCFAWNNYKSYSFQYLHQLQNLYFCLTGEELEIELN